MKNKLTVFVIFAFLILVAAIIGNQLHATQVISQRTISCQQTGEFSHSFGLETSKLCEDVEIITRLGAIIFSMTSWLIGIAMFLSLNLLVELAQQLVEDIKR